MCVCEKIFPFNFSRKKNNGRRILHPIEFNKSSLWRSKQFCHIDLWRCAANGLNVTTNWTLRAIPCPTKRYRFFLSALVFPHKCNLHFVFLLSSLTIWHSGCKQLKIVQYTACSQEEKKCQNKTDHKMNKNKFPVADFDEKTKSY